jgi:hypothetical protein
LSEGQYKYYLTIRSFTSSLTLSIIKRGFIDVKNISAGYTGPHEGQEDFGKELIILINVEQLIYMYTLFMNRFPNVITLNT